MSREGPPTEGRGRPKGPGKLERFKEYLRRRMEKYPELSAAKLFKEIVNYGYAGGLTTLKKFLYDLRPDNHPKAFLRLETQPGEYAQVDWLNIGMITVGNARHKLSCFVMVLSYSRMMYAELTLSQCLEDFMQAHVNAFEYFGGVPKKINYDNLKTVVLSRVGSDIRFHSHFMDLAGYYLFEPVPCGVRMAHEKGKVERGIRFIRTAWLAGRELINYPQLQQDLKGWITGEANTRLHGSTHERPCDRFVEEKRHLQPLPVRPYDCSIVEFPKVSSQALVPFQTNRYSVPYEFCGQTVTLKASSHDIQIYQGDRRLATHRRSYEKHLVFENPAHYENLLAQRKKAQADKTAASFLSLAPECQAYLKGLVESELHVQSHLEKIRKMVQLYGTSDVISALKRALEFQAFGASYIQHILHQQRAARNMPDPQPLILSHKPQWTNVAVEETDLSVYDDLFGGSHDS
jgi:transposase